MYSGSGNKQVNKYRTPFVEQVRLNYPKSNEIFSHYYSDL